MTDQNISLKSLIRRFWKKTLVTWTLVLLEGVALLLMPLVIGWAVDGLVRKEVLGVYQLTSLCLALLVVGAGRRFYDTRVYSGIYRQVSGEMVARERQRKTKVSNISARANLFTEFIEFLENSLPDLFNQFVGLVGTLGIIVFIDARIFWSCFVGAAITAVIYGLSEKRMFRLNSGQNDEFERQVDVLSSDGAEGVKAHFRKLTLWNIRLSDLETINFSLTWIVMAGVLLGAIVMAATRADASIGQVLSIVIYVFGFLESVMTFPLYYQQVVRLQEISERLAYSGD